MKFVTSIMIALVILGASAEVAFADLSSSELRRLRLSRHTDLNRNGEVSAEEILRVRPDAYDRNGDGRLNAAERGVALQRLRRRGFR